MWGRLVENILSAQGEVGGGGGALRKGADGKQHTKDNEAGFLPGGPMAKTLSQLPLQVAWVPSLAIESSYMLHSATLPKKRRGRQRVIGLK